MLNITNINIWCVLCEKKFNTVDIWQYTWKVHRRRKKRPSFFAMLRLRKQSLINARYQIVLACTTVYPYICQRNTVALRVRNSSAVSTVPRGAIRWKWKWANLGLSFIGWTTWMYNKILYFPEKNLLLNSTFSLLFVSVRNHLWC